MVQGVVLVDGDGHAHGNSGAGKLEVEEEVAGSAGSRSSPHLYFIDRVVWSNQVMRWKLGEFVTFLCGGEHTMSRSTQELWRGKINFREPYFSLLLYLAGSWFRHFWPELT